MARRKSTKTKRPIESYQHTGKERANNPPVGLVTPDTDPDAGPRTYAYDPHRSIIKKISNLELQIAKISAPWALPAHTCGLRPRPVGLWL